MSIQFDLFKNQKKNKLVENMKFCLDALFTRALKYARPQLAIPLAPLQRPLASILMAGPTPSTLFIDLPIVCFCLMCICLLNMKSVQRNWLRPVNVWCSAMEAQTHSTR